VRKRNSVRTSEHELGACGDPKRCFRCVDKAKPAPVPVASADDGFVGYYLLAQFPEPGPHEHDHTNGIIYGFLAVYQGRPPQHAGGWLRDLFERAGHHDVWSWGNAGLKTATVFDAENIATSVLGATYLGRVGDDANRKEG